jgi:hypothetical protein
MGVISIAEVTGTVKITVIAKAPPENLIRKATTTDGVTIYGEDYNGDGVADGYQKGVFLGSGKEYTDTNYANGYCTGWIACDAREHTIVIKNIGTDKFNYTDPRITAYSRLDITSGVTDIKTNTLTPESDGSYIITPDKWAGTVEINYIRVSGSYMGADSSVTAE